jgi:phosphatidylserine decarboxylase
MYKLLRYVPKSYASYLFGRLVHMRLPRPIARRSVGWFAKTFGIDVDAASRPVAEYGSIGEFFVRDLREGARPIGERFVSPVDALLRSYGSVENGRLEQVKGRHYGLREFLGDDEDAARYGDATYLNLYLSPRDYHHIHSPVEGRIVKSIHIPGHLWPVNDWSMENIESLFAVNERIVTFIESDYGRVALVMVGATNVGKMSVTYDAFVTNTSFGRKKVETRIYDSPIPIKRGARLGTFHMGSTVVLLVERAYLKPEEISVEQPSKVVFGQTIVR